MEAPFPGNSRSCLYRIILWPVVTGKYPVPEYYFPVQLFREIMWKMAIYRPYFDTSGSRKSQIFKFSLIISLLAGNRAQRQVHSRLHPPPLIPIIILKSYGNAFPYGISKGCPCHEAQKWSLCRSQGDTNCGLRRKVSARKISFPKITVDYL